MDDDLINIQEVKDDINHFLYENVKFIGIEELKVSNEIIDIIGGSLNEIINSIDAM